MASIERAQTILMADIGNSTALYDAIGDVAAHRLVSQSLACMQSAIEEAGGTLVRTVGDAALACFVSPDAALQAASSMQQRHAGLGVSIRVGFHQGPVIADKGDVYGSAVNVAARVAGFAQPGEIVATAAAVDGLCAASQGRCVLFDQVAFKGLADTLALYRIGWNGDEEGATHLVQPLQRRRLDAPQLLPLTLFVPGGELRFDEAGSTVRIGRAGDNDIVFDSDRVSRHHVRIEAVAAQWLLTDASSNGTYVARHGQAVLFVRRESVVLDGDGTLGIGDRVASGATTIGFVIGDDPAG